LLPFAIVVVLHVLAEMLGLTDPTRGILGTCRSDINVRKCGMKMRTRGFNHFNSELKGNPPHTARLDAMLHSS